MEKLTRASLADLAKTKIMISFRNQQRYVGGGTGTQEDPFSYGELWITFKAGTGVVAGYKESLIMMAF